MSRTGFVRIPPQHGAWAYLIIPLGVGWIEFGVQWLTVVFALAWIVAYPVSYFLGRAIAARINRGAWTDRAKRELGYALPWVIVFGVLGVVLMAFRPWLIFAVLALGVLWVVSLALTVKGRERGISNDIVLIAMAATAVPIIWAISFDEPQPSSWPASVWTISAILLVFFAGSVIHVKSLIREARDHRWRIADIVFHALALGLFVVSPWLLIAFIPALARSVAMRPGQKLKPGVIGVVELVMSVLIVVAIALANLAS